MSVKMTFSEHLSLSLHSIAANKLRTFLTALIVAIGITALVGILTSIDAIKVSVNESFSAMGTNSFNIRNRGMNVQIGGGGTRPKAFSPIDYHQARQFQQRYDFPSVVSLNAGVTSSATATFRSNKTNPNVQILGGDEHYLFTSGQNLAQGRNFSAREVEFGANVVIIGRELKERLFKDIENPVGEFIQLGGNRFQVIGVLEDGGSSAGFGGGRMGLIPLSKARSMMSGRVPSYTITISAADPGQLDAAMGEAILLFRNIRGLHTTQTNDFELTRSDALAQVLMQNISFVTLGAVVIAFITLLGASIGLMNIMLVSVTERTREIGLRKSIGATPTLIRKQFLMEAVVICLLGGLAGVLMGLLIGNGIAAILGAQFFIPWAWIGLGLVVCVLVGMISGFYPASKASALDPVEALRYE
jgi:putative ABC transport system permease protein